MRWLHYKKKDKVEILATVTDNHFVVKSDGFSYNINFEKQLCHFGGFRYFFRCPIPQCNRRMRKLYRYGSIIVCRKCFNFGYRSQCVPSSHRFYLMGKKIVNELEVLGGSLYNKPKWMRWKTFEDFKKRYYDYEYKSEMALAEEIHKMYGVYP